MNDNFDTVSKLGEGGQGVVYLVKDRSSGQYYARKLIVCSDMRELNVSLIEVQALLRFTHPHIVGTECFYLSSREEFSMQKYLVYIIYEFCDKDNMREFILRRRKENKNIPLVTVLRWLREMCQAILYIHSKKYIHRDIKPSNIFLSSHNDGYLIIKLGDFGFAKFLRHGKSSTRTILGSQGYISPEMKKQEKYTGKIDCWGIICCFIDLLIDRDFDYAFQLLADKNVVYERIQKRYPLEANVICRFLDTVFLLDPNKRPDSTLLLEEVEKLIERLGIKEEVVNPKSIIEGNEEESTYSKIPLPEVGVSRDVGRTMNDSHHMLKKTIEMKEEEVYFLTKSLNSYSRKYFELLKKVEPKKLKEVFSHKEFDVMKKLMLGMQCMQGKHHEVILAKWKKRNGMIVCLKRPLSFPKEHKLKLDEFKRFVSFEKLRILENENVEKVYGIVQLKNKHYYLIVEGFVNASLIAYLRNFNYKLEIFGKIKLSFGIANGLLGLHHIGLCPAHLSIKKTVLTTVTYESGKRKESKIIGPFIVSREKKRREEDIINLLRIMEIVLCRGSEEFDIMTYKPKNEFEAEYLEIIKEGRFDVSNLTVKNVVYQLSKLVDKQWLHIQMLANRKKSDLSDKGMMILKNLKTGPTHKISLSSSTIGSNSSSSSKSGGSPKSK